MSECGCSWIAVLVEFFAAHPEAIPADCEECGHPISQHGKEGCEYERGDAWIEGTNCGGLVAMGPCGCQAVTLEIEPCESCGAPATHLQQGYDVTPTDRGDERRFMERWVCNSCDPPKEP